jgi:hypothetical protein
MYHLERSIEAVLCDLMTCVGDNSRFNIVALRFYLIGNGKHELLQTILFTPGKDVRHGYIRRRSLLERSHIKPHPVSSQDNLNEPHSGYHS